MLLTKTQRMNWRSCAAGHPTARQRSGGYSLIELVMAVALVGGTLVPALALIRDGMELSRTTDDLQLLVNYGVQKMEEQLGVVAANWATGTSQGDFATDGFSSIRFTTSASDNPASGGLTDRLMHIQVTTYLDLDNDDSLDASEPRRDFRTKIAKIATYVSKSGA